MLIFSLLLVIAFEATNGFHDASNAVATVIYTKSLAPGQAVVWPGHEFCRRAGRRHSRRLRALIGIALEESSIA